MSLPGRHHLSAAVSMDLTNVICAIPLDAFHINHVEEKNRLLLYGSGRCLQWIDAGLPGTQTHSGRSFSTNDVPHAHGRLLQPWGRFTRFADDLAISRGVGSLPRWDGKSACYVGTANYDRIVDRLIPEGSPEHVGHRSVVNRDRLVGTGEVTAAGSHPTRAGRGSLR